jgi:hypothetical protein
MAWLGNLSNRLIEAPELDAILAKLDPSAA